MNVCGLMLRTVARCVVCALGTPVSHARTDDPIDRNSGREAEGTIYQMKVHIGATWQMQCTLDQSVRDLRCISLRLSLPLL